MSALDFETSLAVVIGINQYSHGISPLQTAVADAQSVAQLLEKEHGYTVLSLLDEKAQLVDLKNLIQQTLPSLLSTNSRLLLYFAGHGIAQDGDDGPAGYLIPQDAVPGDVGSYLSMVSFHDELTALPCRHFLAIFDCCFAGAFRWSSTRKATTVSAVIHRERYDRFRQDPAWQVITSASYDQPAMDVLSLRDERGEVIDSCNQQHSPFAAALIQALQGEADSSPPAKDGQPAGDGVTTATELYLYLRDQVEVLTEGQGLRQTPEICTLRNHDKGEYIFLTPGQALNLPPAPTLNKKNNPYRGLESFEQTHKDLFFGRDEEIERLLKKLDEPHPMVVVLGASGTGKSSLVKAGLLPRLANDPAYQVLPVMRPGNRPLAALERAFEGLVSADESKGLTSQFLADEQSLAGLIGNWQQRHPKTKLLLVIDQAEELLTQADSQSESTQCQRLVKQAMAKHWQYFRVVATLRLDFEAQFQEEELREGWMDARFVIPPMSQAQLREAIEKPATARVLYFEPSSLINKLVEDVAQTPGALPLLSFTLSELYLRYLERHSDNRALTEADYRALGGVAGALTRRATQEYESLVSVDNAYGQTVKNVMLRMVALEGGELARRRVPLSELVYANKAENERVQQLLENLIAARLIVRGQEGEGEPYVEPAHDALVRGWDKLLRWKNAEQVNLGLQRELMPQARNWQIEEKTGESKRSRGFLWDENPRLDLLKAVLDSDNNWLNAAEESFVRRSDVRKRNRRTRLISSMAVAIAVLGVISAVALIQRQEARRQTTVAQLREHIATARTLLETNPVEAAVRAIYVTRKSEAHYRELLSSSEGILLSSIQNSREENLFRGHEGEVLAVAMSPDGKMLASAGTDGKVILINLSDSSQEIVDNFENSSATSVSFSHSGELLAIADSDGNVRVRRLKDNALLCDYVNESERLSGLIGQDVDFRRVYGTDPKTVVTFNPQNDNYLVSAGPDNRIDQLDMTNGNCNKQSLAVLEAETVEQKQDYRVYPPLPTSISFSPDGQKLAIGVGYDSALLLYDLSAETTKVLWEGQSAESVEGISFEEKIFFSICIHEWAEGNSTTIQTLYPSPYGDFRISEEEFSVHEDCSRTVLFDPENDSVISGGSDRGDGSNLVSFITWKSSDRFSFVGHQGSVSALAITQDHQRFVSAGIDGTVRVWSVDSFSRNVSSLFRNQPNNEFEIWDFVGRRLTLTRLDGGIKNEVQSKSLIETSGKDTPFISNQQYPKTFVGYDGQVVVTVEALSDSSNGKPATALTSEKRVLIKNRTTDVLLGELNMAGNILFVAANHSQDKVVVIKENTIAILNFQGETLGSFFNAQQSNVAAISPDGRMIALAKERFGPGSRATPLQLFDIEGNVVGKVENEGLVEFLAFSPDSRYLITDKFGEVQFFPANWHASIENLCDRLRYHPILSNPQDEIAREAQEICQKWHG